MSNNNENESWDWECQEYNFEDSTNIEISKWHLGGVKENEDHFSSILDDETTPVKACGDLTCHVTEKDARRSCIKGYVSHKSAHFLIANQSYILIPSHNNLHLVFFEFEEMSSGNSIWKQQLVDIGIVTARKTRDWGYLGINAFCLTTAEVTGKAESEECRELSSQVKRRRMLQFEFEVLNAPLYNDDIFLRSKETQDSLEANMHDMSEWVSGFADGASASNNECLDPLFEGWIADYFNETEIHCSAEDMSDPSGASDVQINITEVCKMSPECDANAVTNHPINSRRSGAFKGRKSYMCTLPKPSSSVVYPFAFIKPCGAHGDMTLEDINQKLHAPPKSKQDQEDDASVSYPTSAFSGKPVVGKTKIQTEGGEGSITIMRTKG